MFIEKWFPYLISNLIQPPTIFSNKKYPCRGFNNFACISYLFLGSGLSTPFSLVYPGAPGTMFLPSQTQAAGVVSQQQLQFQAATALREAVQSQVRFIDKARRVLYQIRLSSSFNVEILMNPLFSTFKFV